MLRGFASLITVCLCTLCGTFFARAKEKEMLVDGEIRQLVVSADRVAAIRGDELLVLTVAGQRLGRPGPGREAIPAPARRPRPGAEDIVDLFGLPDDDRESGRVAEILDDEDVDEDVRAAAGRRGTGRRTAHPTDGNRRTPRVLAASRDAIWIATRGGLLWLPGAGSTPGASARAALVGQPGLSLSALAVTPGGDGLAALIGNSVLRSGDGGLSWAVLAVMPTRARSVEISADGGEIYVLDEDGVAVVAHRQRIPLFEGRVHHLARCGDDLLILGDEGLYAWRWQQGLQKRGGRMPAHRIVCSPSLPDALIAIGTDLLSSFDGGRSWVPRVDVPTLDITSVAFATDQIFIGATTGLFVAPLRPPSDARGNQAPRTRAGGRRADGQIDTTLLEPSPPVAPRAGPWLALLPRVSLGLSAATSHPGGTRSAVWLLLTLPLGRARGPRAADAQRAGDVLRRRAAAARELLRLADAPDSDNEAAALLRAALDRVEALR